MSRPADRFAYIVTGTTRGIGKALADAILSRGHRLFSLSRTTGDTVDRRNDYTCDLAKPGQRRKAMDRAVRDLLKSTCNHLVLINNAGVLEPIGPVDKQSQARMADHMQVNLIAPIYLMGAFIKGTHGFAGRRRIINISSGAGRHPYAGWSLYCSAKAGLDMATRCVALEQRAANNDVVICALAPGVVETDMQTQIRSATDTDFPERPRFVAMQKEARLPSAESVAELILDLDAAQQFESGGLYDLRDVSWKQEQPSIAPREKIG